MNRTSKTEKYQDSNSIPEFSFNTLLDGMRYAEQLRSTKPGLKENLFLEAKPGQDAITMTEEKPEYFLTNGISARIDTQRWPLIDGDQKDFGDVYLLSAGELFRWLRQAGASIRDFNRIYPREEVDSNGKSWDKDSLDFHSKYIKGDQDIFLKAPDSADRTISKLENVTRSAKYTEFSESWVLDSVAERLGKNPGQEFGTALNSVIQEVRGRDPEAARKLEIRWFNGK